MSIKKAEKLKSPTQAFMKNTILFLFCKQLVSKLMYACEFQFEALLIWLDLCRYFLAECMKKIYNISLNGEEETKFLPKVVIFLVNFYLTNKHPKQTFEPNKFVWRQIIFICEEVLHKIWQPKTILKTHNNRIPNILFFGLFTRINSFAAFRSRINLKLLLGAAQLLDTMVS